MKIILLLLLLTCSIIHVSAETPEERQKRIQERIGKKLDELRASPPKPSSPKGLVFQPPDSQDTTSNYTQLEFKELPVRLAAEVYAQLLKKEIFVSARVEELQIDVPLTKGTPAEVARVLESALDKAGVSVVSVDSHSVALVPSIPK